MWQPSNSLFCEKKKKKSPVSNYVAQNCSYNLWILDVTALPKNETLFIFFNFSTFFLFITKLNKTTYNAKDFHILKVSVSPVNNQMMAFKDKWYRI